MKNATFPKAHFIYEDGEFGGFYQCKHCDWMDVSPSSHVEHCNGDCKYIQLIYDISYIDGEVYATKKIKK
ncbi:MAG: hypothetical protein EOP00_29250 [Pedobacter sp.]|nr:MAG: hypothetical protein EOP00_29250 [Pedobacter sp.]